MVSFSLYAKQLLTIRLKSDSNSSIQWLMVFNGFNYGDYVRMKEMLVEEYDSWVNKDNIKLEKINN